MKTTKVLVLRAQQLYAQQKLHYVALTRCNAALVLSCCPLLRFITSISCEVTKNQNFQPAGGQGGKFLGSESLYKISQQSISWLLYIFQSGPTNAATDEAMPLAMAKNCVKSLVIVNVNTYGFTVRAYHCPLID